MSLYQRDERSLSKLQKLRFFPLAVTGGTGGYLINEDGRHLLDRHFFHFLTSQNFVTLFKNFHFASNGNGGVFMIARNHNRFNSCIFHF